MKLFKRTKFDNPVEMCTYPKCNKEVHEVGEKYCGEHQRYVENFKDKATKVGKATIGSLFVGGAMLLVRTVKDKLNI